MLAIVAIIMYQYYIYERPSVQPTHDVPLLISKSWNLHILYTPSNLLDITICRHVLSPRFQIYRVH
mgnify:CR=1 FL=1